MTQTMTFFDTHAHLGDPRLRSELDAVLNRSREAGVREIITVGADMPSSILAVEMAGCLENVYASVGIHPHDARLLGPKEMARLKELSLDEHVVAIGEIGLDYYYDHSPRDSQKEAFAAQMEMASECGIPVIIHNRDAEGDCLDILSRFGPGLTGTAHCFSGGAEAVEAFLDLGLHISFSGTVTYPNARKTAEASKMVPNDRLLIETDCPYLAPQPVRGRTNEPAFVGMVAERLAELRETDVQTIAAITTDNARKLFGSE